MKQWFAQIITNKDTKLVRVKSWLPWISQYGIEWPVLLIDRCGMRSTVVPVWDRHQLRAVFRHLLGRW